MHAMNWLAVLVAAVVRMILGAAWFSPPVLLKPWLAAAGVSESEMKARFPRALAADVAGSLLMAYGLARILNYAGANSLGFGLALGFLVWVSFIAVTSFSAMLYEHRPFKLWLIGNGYQLVALLVMGAILAAWS